MLSYKDHYNEKSNMRCDKTNLIPAECISVMGGTSVIPADRIVG